MNQTNIENVKKALKITIARQGRDNTCRAIYEILRNKNIGLISHTDNARDLIKKMRYEELRDAILNIFSEISGEKIELNTETVLYIASKIGYGLPDDYILPNGEVFNIEEHRDNISKIPIVASLSGCDGLDYRLTQSHQIGNMQIASNQGFIRQNQEDAGIIMQHPKNPKFKMLAVADGMGGLNYGEYASDYLVNKLKEWFNTLPTEFYEDRLDSVLRECLQGKINEFSNDINNLYGDGGTTFLCAIVRDKNTLIASVGDSIAYGYRYRDNRFVKLNVDDSKVSDLYRSGYFPEVRNEDDLRFNKHSNEIFSYIGGGLQNPYVHFSAYPTDVTIVLCTDGVSDCISMTFLKDFLGAFRTNMERAAELIVNIATDRNRIDIVPDYLKNNPNYKDKILPGGDNATVAIYNPEEERT